MVAVGLFFRAYTFHRAHMPALSRDGKLKLLPPMKAAKIPIISNIHPIFNESGIEYSAVFKTYWTISRKRAAEMEGGS